MKNWENCLPNNSTLFLSQDDVLQIHRILIKRFGGLSGVRDLNLLTSALYRPQTGYYNTLVEMAAALFESLINNHPFIDGNKRVAFFSTDVFLRLNGYQFSVDSTTAYNFLMSLFKHHHCDLAHLTPWIEASIIPSK